MPDFMASEMLAAAAYRLITTKNAVMFIDPSTIKDQGAAIAAIRKDISRMVNFFLTVVASETQKAGRGNYVLMHRATLCPEIRTYVKQGCFAIGEGGDEMTHLLEAELLAWAMSWSADTRECPHSPISNVISLGGTVILCVHPIPERRFPTADAAE